MNWYPEAESLLLQEKYQELVAFYEQQIEADPDNVDNYWYLGLAYLLLGKEEEANTTWFFPLGFAGEEEIEFWTENLVNILDREALRQETINNYHLTWLIRSHLREITPQNFSNLLRFIQLSINLKKYDSLDCFLENIQLLKLLTEQKNLSELEKNTLINIFLLILPFPNQIISTLFDYIFPYLSNYDDFCQNIFSVIIKDNLTQKNPIWAIELLNLCLKLKPKDLYIINCLIECYSLCQNYQTALKLATTFYENSPNISAKIHGNAKIISILMKSANWLKLREHIKIHSHLLELILENNEKIEPPFIAWSFIKNARMMPYIQDQAKENRILQNQLSRIFYQNLITHTNINYPNNNSQILETKKLKIGYIASTLRRHSVGWLSRWLFKYHNTNNFAIYIYLVNQVNDEITKIWFFNNRHITYNFPPDTKAIFQKIKEDQINILVDLDSITKDTTCEVLALKPAPIQVTWLGLDATGLPTVDYFLADPYVLPEKAQEYYQEKIWRLPQTYLAVDGFEVFAPTLKRQDLEISDSQIVYFSSQNGWKRNPENIKLQLEIIKNVPHSLLLLKGLGEQENMKKLFYDLASEIGIEKERLKFLPQFSCEEIYRANLQELADIVLDTYPYTGATTTLETLWLGIPLVTRVGEQWAARNSYTFMINAGITAGIAWNDQEYIDWGIRLGKDEYLREKIAWKLRQSKKTSPLWNAKNFTLEMENSYSQMWEIYSHSK